MMFKGKKKADSQHIDRRALGIKSLGALLKKGYSFKELMLNGFSLKIWSKFLASIRYSFLYKGKRVDIDHRAVINGSKYISLGDHVWVQRHAWLVVPLLEINDLEKRAYLTIKEGVAIGPDCTISAANKITIGKNVLFGPNVTVLDHKHNFEDINTPVSAQGISSKGEIEIEENAWIGVNAVIYSANKKIVIGKNSVVAANSVVTSSVAPYSVVAGAPARPVKVYDQNNNKWETIKT